ncbi:MAG: branched-chain amino acid ABC transporter permease [Pseudomonadota bacterium]|nr:branched-chain amino acid ABC transporter permease [Pseudomonadota bacterium]
MLFAAVVLLPAVASRSIIDVLVFAALYAIAGLGVSFLLGQCGIVSLAQSVFYGIGAYSTAYCTTQLGWPAAAGFAFGMGISAIIAAAVGWPVLRLSGYFLALATLALGIIGHVLFLEWDWLTGGTLGIGGIPPLNLFGFMLNTPQRFYYLVWIVVLVVFWLHASLLRSRTGYAMRAMRDAPAAAAALGVNNQMLKAKVFVLSAVLGALAGSLFAHYVSFVSVDSFGVDRAINFLLLAVLGGASTIIGPILGALFITVMPHALSTFGDIHALLFAACLVAAVIFLPDGLAGLLRRAPAKEINA